MFDFVFLWVLSRGLGIIIPRMGIRLKSFEAFNIVNVIGDLYTSGGHPNFITCTNSLLLLGSRAIIGVGVGLCGWTRWTCNDWGLERMSCNWYERTVAGRTFGFGGLFSLLRGFLLGAILFVGIGGVAVVVIFFFCVMKIILVSLVNMSMFFVWNA